MGEQRKDGICSSRVCSGSGTFSDWGFGKVEFGGVVTSTTSGVTPSSFPTVGLLDESEGTANGDRQSGVGYGDHLDDTCDKGVGCFLGRLGKTFRDAHDVSDTRLRVGDPRTRNKPTQAGEILFAELSFEGQLRQLQQGIP